MLFQIDNSVLGLLSSNAARTPDFAALDCLAQGAFEGSHRIAGERKVLIKLANLDSLHRRTRKVFARAAERFAQEGRLAFMLPTIARVVAGTQATRPNSTMIGKQRVIEFPLSWFDWSGKIQPTILLGENLSDVRVFRKMGEVGLILAGLGYLPLAKTDSHGGGSTTGVVLGQHAASERLCLCIVDSDKLCPQSAFGGTARTTAAYKDQQTYPLVEVFETTGRDLENTLPDSFFLTAYDGHPAYASIANLVVSLTTEGEAEVRAHLDIKKRAHPGQYMEALAKFGGRDFWRSKLSSILKVTGIQSANLPCLVGMSCADQRGDCSVCVIVTGNHANVLDDFIRMHENTGPHELCKILDDSVRGEWERLGSAIASWCCGDSRLRL